MPDHDTQQHGITSFALKIIAIVAMTFNHVAFIFGDALSFPVLCVFTAAGGITFPIMAFLLKEGYRHTRSVRNYALRLLVFAAIAQVPWFLFVGASANVLFTLLLGLLLLWLDDNMENRAGFGIAVLAVLAVSIACDWAIIGPLMILLFKRFEKRQGAVAFPVIVAMVSLGVIFGGSALILQTLEPLPSFLEAVVGCGASIILLRRYNGKRGKPLKYFFYVYYPAHLAILGILHLAI